MTEPASPEPRRYHRELEAVLAEASALASGLSAAQLGWKPSPKRWSVAECLNHLTVTAEKYLPRVDGMISQARAEGLTGEGPFRHPYLGNWFGQLMEPPPRRKFRVPGPFAPDPAVPPGETPERFRRTYEALRDRVTESDGLDLAAVSTTSPAARFFSLTLGQCFAALAAHARRHLWQARRVREEADFPAGGQPG